MVMRFKCSTRLLYGTSGSGNRRYAKSIASLVKGDKPNSCKLILERCETNRKSRQEFQLAHSSINAIHDSKVDDSLLSVCTSDPRATIFFRGADKTQLKSFASILKAIKQNVDIKPFALLQEPVKTKAIDWTSPGDTLVVRNERDYPIGRSLCPRLRSVLVSGLNMDTLDDRLLRLTYLRELCLPQNNISDIDVDLGELLGNCHLETLDLSGNLLTTFPCITAGPLLTSLVDLDLSHNQIVWLPNSIWLLTGLSRLNLSHNLIDHLPEGLSRKNRVLKRLLLTGNPFPCLPASARHLRLQYLDLSDPKWPSNHQRIWRGHEFDLKADDEEPFACRMLAPRSNFSSPLSLQVLCQKRIARTPPLARHIRCMPQALQEEFRLMDVCCRGSCPSETARYLTAWEPQVICVRLICGGLALEPGGRLVINPEEPATIQQRWCLPCYRKHLRKRLRPNRIR